MICARLCAALLPHLYNNIVIILLMTSNNKSAINAVRTTLSSLFTVNVCSPFHKFHSSEYLCKIKIYREQLVRHDIPRCSFMSDIDRVPHVLPVPFTHVTDHLTFRISDWSRIWSIWSLLCTSVVELIRPVYAIKKKMQCKRHTCWGTIA